MKNFIKVALSIVVFGLIIVSVIVLSLDNNAKIFVEFCRNFGRTSIHFIMKVWGYIHPYIIPFCSLVITRVTLGINCKLSEMKYLPLISLNLMTENLHEPNVKEVREELRRDFYDNIAENRIDVFDKESLDKNKIHVQKMLGALSITDTGKHLMWMAYDATSANNVCSLYLSSCPLDYRRNLNDVKIDYSSIIVMKNLGASINSFFVKSIVVEYLNDETVTIKNVKEEIRFNKVINAEEEFYILITEIFSDEKYRLCSPESIQQKGPPNYKKIILYCTVRNIFFEVFDFETILNFNGISVDFEMKGITTKWQRAWRKILGIRVTGRKSF